MQQRPTSVCKCDQKSTWTQLLQVCTEADQNTQQRGRQKGDCTSIGKAACLQEASYSRTARQGLRTNEAK